MYHAAVTFANAFMNAGTTSDEFLRQNLEWLSRATNWSKFSATAALGVLHKGHISQGQALLAPYLPQDGVSSSQYSEGGALFALGLIFANHGAGIIPYLSNTLKNTQSEVIQHGACLGIGVAGMATANDDLYEQLKSILFSDSAIAGEAAGYALGLVMLGTASQKAIDEMLQYAHETQHEKIIRGLAVGMSLIMYGKEEEADTLIEQLCTDKVGRWRAHARVWIIPRRVANPNILAIFRTTSFATEVSLPSPWPTPERATTKPSAASCTSPSRTSTTTSVALPSCRSDLCCSGRRSRFRGWCSCSLSRTIRM